MQAPDHSVAKREVGRAMIEGRSWREAVQEAGVQMSRATAYRLRQRVLAGGEDALDERRQGHEGQGRCDLAGRWRRYERVRDREDREETRYTRYCLEQCDRLRALAELEAKERAMYELENGKDQCMTVLKLALTNLGMWVRAHYFPAAYAHATWNRLLPFFRLPGRVTEGKQTLLVELRPFNDRQLNRDLRVVCERVAAAQLRLPDGRRLRFTISGTGCLKSDG